MTPAAILTLFATGLLSSEYFHVYQDNTRQIQIQNGSVIGHEQALLPLNKSVWQFLGLPFAEPPTDSRRFARPHPIMKTWGNLTANRMPTACMQPTNTFQVSEDCLYLNIWTPMYSSKTNRSPVMVWIHGGAYERGRSELYQGTLLSAMGDVVVVVIQYRLGPFGFFRLDSEHVTGNWGMWDQLMALQWIHENIAEFGGDPEQVTIFGESAGSGSVSLHLLNPRSDKYFQRAILESGVLHNQWAYSPYMDAVADGHRHLATNLLFCGGSSRSAVMNCLRQKSPLEIQTAYQQLKQERSLDTMPFMDGDFFREDPEMLLRHGRFSPKDILIGINNDEGANILLARLISWAAAQGLPFDPTLAFLTGNILTQAVKDGITYFPRFPHRLTSTGFNFLLLEAISRKNENDGILNARKLADLVSESYFFCGFNRFIDGYRQRNSSIYTYEFAHRSSRSSLPTWINAGHGSEIVFVFGGPLFDSRYTSAERQLSMEMVHDWTSFAKTGRPANSIWTASSSKKKEFLRLETPRSSWHEYAYQRDRCSFWEDSMPFISRLEYKFP